MIYFILKYLKILVYRLKLRIQKIICWDNLVIFEKSKSFWVVLSGHVLLLYLISNEDLWEITESVSGGISLRINLTFFFINTIFIIEFRIT